MNFFGTLTLDDTDKIEACQAVTTVFLSLGRFSLIPAGLAELDRLEDAVREARRLMIEQGQ